MRRAVAALTLAALAAACQPGTERDRADPQRFSHTLAAAPGPTVAGAEGPALPGAAGGLAWAPLVSPEVTHRLAERYCADLPPFGPAPWRIPTADELAGAPVGRFPFRAGDRLWTEDRPPEVHHRRVVVDPLTGARDSRAPALALHLRVLCVAGPP